MNGLLVVDKEPGPTSRAVVGAVRRVTGQRKIGHGGTLDPLASGVLLVALGTATRLLEYLLDQDKRYEVDVVLGATSPTDDAEGPVTICDAAPTFGIVEIDGALTQLRGEITQRPPAYSAVSIGGRRMYEMARAGSVQEGPLRHVTVYRLDVLEWRSPRLRLDIACSKGTYVRSIARDLGELLDCGAYVGGLVRIASGRFTREQAHTLHRLQSDPTRVPELMLPQLAAIDGWPAIALDANDVAAIRQGKAVAWPDGALGRCRVEGQVVTVWPQTCEGVEMRDGMLAGAVDAAQTLIAVVRWEHSSARWRPVKVVG